MKSLYVIVLMFSVMFSSCATNKKINKVVYNERTEQKILIGKVNRKGLEKRQFKEWFQKEYNSYKPEEKIIKVLKERMPENAQIVIVMATWCPDSRREVPRFYKILDEIGFNEQNLTVYCVDRQKRDEKGDVDQYQVERVPTIIYSHYNYEAGRIIETPINSLERDLLEFTKKK